MTKPEPTFAVYLTEQELWWLTLTCTIAAQSWEDLFLDQGIAPPGTMIDREDAIATIQRGTGKLAARLNQIPSKN